MKYLLILIDSINPQNVKIIELINYLEENYKRQSFKIDIPLVSVS